MVELTSAAVQLSAFYFKVEQVETEESFEMPQFFGILKVLLKCLKCNL